MATTLPGPMLEVICTAGMAQAGPSSPVVGHTLALPGVTCGSSTPMTPSIKPSSSRIDVSVDSWSGEISDYLHMPSSFVTTYYYCTTTFCAMSLPNMSVLPVLFSFHSRLCLISATLPSSGVKQLIASPSNPSPT